ncbi:transcriptional regulator [Lasius niger]|uniref:Transcriptional regulator n=1 Tax=Lasius niger TaxID=67767 RepID=A0A0J7K919_LASNI|nr:transcriptional regulator [Lasius niger]
MSDEALAAAQARAESAETQLAELQAQLLAQAVIAAPGAADQLPREHRAILVATGVTDLNRLAEAAYRMADSALGTDLNASAVSKINMTRPIKPSYNN